MHSEHYTMIAANTKSTLKYFPSGAVYGFSFPVSMHIHLCSEWKS